MAAGGGAHAAVAINRDLLGALRAPGALAWSARVPLTHEQLRRRKVIRSWIPAAFTVAP